MSNPDTQAPNTAGNVQTVLTNLQYTIEVLREELTRCQEEKLSAKVALRKAQVTNKQLQDKLEQLSDLNQDQSHSILEIENHLSETDDQLQSVVWHLSCLSGKEITPEYLEEVQEMWRGNKDAKKRRENQEKVRDAVKEQQGRDIDLPETVAEIDHTINASERALKKYRDPQDEKPTPADEMPAIEPVDEVVEAETEEVPAAREPSNPKAIHAGKHKHKKTKQASS
tara:strand:- start:3936 stop:4613 length:678 start_codon:yes stop_codon:yes gene_type:complete